MTGDFTYSSQPVDNISEYSATTLYSEPTYPVSNYKISHISPHKLTRVEENNTFEDCVVLFQSLVRASSIRFKNMIPILSRNIWRRINSNAVMSERLHIKKNKYLKVQKREGIYDEKHLW